MKSSLKPMLKTVFKRRFTFLCPVTKLKQEPLNTPQDIGGLVGVYNSGAENLLDQVSIEVCSSFGYTSAISTKIGQNESLETFSFHSFDILAPCGDPLPLQALSDVC